MGLNWKKKESLPTLAEKKAAEVNAACEAAIHAGADLALSEGDKHFAFTDEDQLNINSMMTAVQLGAARYLYHEDGGACRMYSAADIVKIFVGCKAHVTYHTTYCNALKQWISRETDPAVLGAITYGSELPEDLAAQMQQLLTEVQAEVERVVEQLGSE